MLSRRPLRRSIIIDGGWSAKMAVPGPALIAFAS
jgi:hypothetical protein